MLMVPYGEQELSPASSEPPAAVPPRLGLVHLFVWMAVSAVLAASASFRASVWLDLPPETLIRFRIVYLISSTLGGAAVTILWITASGYLRGPRWYIEPGEFFAAILGTIVLLADLINLLNYRSATLNPQPELVPLLWTVQQVLFFNLVQFIAFGIGIIRKNYAMSWRAAFGIATAAALLKCANAFSLIGGSNILYPTTYDIMLSKTVVIAILFAVLQDRRQHRRRNWLHWAGIGIVMSEFIFELAEHYIVWR